MLGPRSPEEGEMGRESDRGAASRRSWRGSAGALGLLVALAVASPAGSREAGGTPGDLREETSSNSTGPSRSRGFIAAAKESLVGDVYANPERWQPLSWGTLFSEGWDEAWVSPPSGPGGAPRQGWLNSADGVFYRLVVGGPTYTSGREGAGGDVWEGGFTAYLPLSRRLEMRFDVPLVRSTQGFEGSGTNASFGDLRVVPRILLSETLAVSQCLDLDFRVPTGDLATRTGAASFFPNYQFWANWWGGLVLRGGVGWRVAYHEPIETGTRSGFLGDLAAGWYWTSHDFTPLGDFVTLVSANVFQPTDDRAARDVTDLSLTPGFRTHLGRDVYLLGALEVPVTFPNSYDYRVTTDLMWVF